MVVKKINSDSLFKASFSNIMDTNLIPYRKISSRCRDYWQKINPPTWQLITSDVNLINFFFNQPCRMLNHFFFQRVLLFSTYAMSAMCQAGFDVIDVYPMTDSYPRGTLDEVHYPDRVFHLMETMLEKYKTNGNMRVNIGEGGIRRCIG